MNQFSNFTSLPPEQEATFVVYEQQSAQASQKGMTIGLISGVAIGLIMLIISIAVPAEKSPHAEPEPGSQKATTEKK